MYVCVYVPKIEGVLVRSRRGIIGAQLITTLIFSEATLDFSKVLGPHRGQVSSAACALDIEASIIPVLQLTAGPHPVNCFRASFAAVLRICRVIFLNFGAYNNKLM